MSARVILWISVILNLLLGAWIAFRLWAGSAAAGAGATPSAATTVSPGSDAPSAPEPALPPGLPTFHWSQVESPDYRVYVANLRAIDCPERTVRNILSAELDELYTRKRQELLRPLFGQLWDFLAQAVRNPQQIEKAMRSQVEQLEQQTRQLLQEKEKMLAELLGKPEPDPDPATPTRPAPQMAGYLSEEKQSQVNAIERKYAQLETDIRRDRSNAKAPDTDARLADLQKQKQAELQGTLSAEEYDEYRLRTSRAAGLRNRVQGLEASPEEWRELVRRQMEFDEANPAGKADPVDAKTRLAQREQALAQLDEQFKAVLGPDRFEAFKRGQQSDYQDALRVAERCELPAAAAVQVYEVKRATETQMRELRDNPALTAEQRATALESIRRETEASIRSAFGDRGFQTYLDYRGDWLKNVGQR